MANSTLTDSQVHMLSQLILSYHDVFSLQEQECGKIDGITHATNIDNHPPPLDMFLLLNVRESNPKQPSCKKSVRPQKGHSGKRCEIQGGGQEMAVMVG